LLIAKATIRDLTPKSRGQTSRSQGHVTYSIKNAITQHWVIISTSYLGANIYMASQLVGHKVVAMAMPVA